MDRLIRKYADKLVRSGLAEAGTPLLGAWDAELIWNREDEMRPLIEKIFAGLHISALLFAQPAEPYRTLVDFLARTAPSGVLRPEDTETRTFLHDLPVVTTFEAEKLIQVLKKRKCAILPGRGIIACGTVSPEQAFVTFSSACFACFVKFFADVLRDVRAGSSSPAQQAAFRQAVEHLDPPAQRVSPLLRGPFRDEATVLTAMEEAGKATVDCGLVDSYFGNISCLFEDILYISQTGSSLDELQGCIDPVPLDGSSCAGITASSELSAHRAIVARGTCRTILHGHPKFSVVLSLACGEKNCEVGLKRQCHLCCPRPRRAAGVPIVPGEVGTGLHGLCHTVPPALADSRGVIVYGHGVFTAGRTDFNGALSSLLEIEKGCREEYFARL
ncbi:class II aldolase/adducin family protein [Syntrophus sp. (in: bacteria)]|uniref:class II aldolase/adducin family protein n=1 Tax=Syntrophus sp. (in: bacteria) TaxID=48412 RepID=UPI00345E197A